MVDYISTVSAMSAKIFFYAVIIMGIVFFLGLMWAIYYFMSYKNKAVVYDAERKDSAKIVRFKIKYGKGIIHFFKPKPNKMLVPHADCFVPFKRTASFLSVEQNGEFFMPLRISPNPGFLNGAGDFQAIKLWHIQDVKETEALYAKKQSLFWQYAPIALCFVVIIIHFIVMLMLIKKGSFGGGGGGSEGPGVISQLGSQFIPGK